MKISSANICAICGKPLLTTFAKIRAICGKPFLTTSASICAICGKPLILHSLKFSLIFLFLFNGYLTSFSQSKNPYLNFSEDYTNVITARSAKIVNTLDIADSMKYYRVLSIIVEQYRNLSATHDFKDALIKQKKDQNITDKDAQINSVKDSANAALYLMHARFLAVLASELDANQIEKVKDGMTYNVMHNTYNAFLDMLPELTGDQKRYIYTALYEARELAMDESSSKAKHAMFGKYKGRINNYLSAQGYDLAKRSKEWQERLKNEDKSKE
ncbi:MAG: DUF3826 domain-containing protein [Bacteroidales bacterium]|nr:DUF3826 domain-containing protein [Bacteroidales bacterium]